MSERTEQDIMKKWKGDRGIPIVSICTITYNHEKFITEALDSFLMQETDFPFEIVIDDDCSPDNTAAIIRKYADKYPNIIKANLRDYNIGALDNFRANMQRARGKYIALCEGDDYWTDPLKLQKQVNFLENNKEYVLVSANALITYEKDSYDTKIKSKNFTENFDYTVRELMTMYPSPMITLTTMFRNIEDYSNIPFDKYWAGDKQLWMYLMQYGKGRFMIDIVGVYRKHKGGVTASISNTIYKKIKLIEDRMKNHQWWNDFYDYKYDLELEYLIKKESGILSILYMKNSDFKKAICISRYADYKYMITLKQKIILFVLKNLSKIFNCASKLSIDG